jgi:hypothetical protein
VVQVAVPLPTGWAPQPLIDDPPSLKSTVPDGLDPVTVAVKVTGCPAVEGFCEGTTAVEEKTGR